MKLITFHTNIDQYSGNLFPENLHFVPRMGEYVYLKKLLHAGFIQAGFPVRLEVVNVSHTEDYVEIELWFSDTDFKILKEKGVWK